MANLLEGQSVQEKQAADELALQQNFQNITNSTAIPAPIGNQDAGVQQQIKINQEYGGEPLPDGSMAKPFASAGTNELNQMQTQYQTISGQRQPGNELAPGDVNNIKNAYGIQQTQEPVQQQQMQQGIQLDPEQQRVFDLYNSSIATNEKAAREAANAKAAYFDQSARIQQQDLEKQKQAQAAFDLDWDKKMKDMDDNVAELRRLSKDKVIPGDFLARQDTTGSLMTGIAVALGAFAATASGTNTNLGLSMIDKAIDRDIEAQKYNIDSALRFKKEEIDLNKSILGRMREKYQDENSARIAAKATMLATVESQMQSQIAKTSLPLQARAQALDSYAKVQGKKLELLGQLKAAQMQASMMAMVDDGNLTPDQAAFRYGDRAKNYVPGLGISHSLEIAKIGNEKILPVKNTLASIRDILNFARSGEYNKMSPTDRSVMTSKLRNLQMELKGKANYELGVLTGPDMEILTDITGDPNKIFTASDQLARLEDAYNRTQDKFYRDVSTYFPQSKLNMGRQQAQNKLK